MSIEAYPSPNGVLTSLIWRKTAAGGETSLSGYDNASQALSYTPGQEQVYLNGILLVRGSDYTATNGTSITGLTALTADDFVQVNCYNNFSVASVPAASITGTVTNAQLANSAITINGTSTSLGGTYTNASASTSTAGIVQLTDSTSSTSTSTAATPNSVKSAYDLANGAIPKTLTTTTGDIIYASGANTPARLGIGSTGNVLTVSGGVPSWSAPASATFVGVKVTKSADQTIASATEAQITWNQEEFKTDTDFHSNTTNNSRLTVPTGKGGYYRIYAEMQWQNTSSTARKIIAVYLNGEVTQIGTFETGSIGFPSCIVSFTQNLSAGDYIQLYAYNGTAGNLDFRSSLAFFGMEKIG